ncbi:ribonuclease H [Pluteus cervinus]|uniref:Ribonuclease H n=1 Tax=Pluteus cervinus TaxID=181527 RepID=A0ACD3AH32_9AGAR|nr:ribonuclease H [Pluteus cervinus]
MKRSQERSSTPVSPKPKKFKISSAHNSSSSSGSPTRIQAEHTTGTNEDIESKMSPMVLAATTTTTATLTASISTPVVDDDLSAWARVEKKKQKKVRKAEVKFDALQPRFLYSSSEIVKRHWAIGIEEIRELVLHIIADAPPPNWLRIDNALMIQKVVALLVPGITPELLSLPPFPTSATSNPNLPIPIPLLPKASPDALSTTIPFIASTFSHACPTRAPGDQTRMHSALSTFFQGPVSAEEKKKRILQRLAYSAEQGSERNPSQYVLTLEQMIENDYPIPAYMADVFEKPPGWVETPKPTVIHPGLVGHRIYAIDCEMCLTEDGKELTRVCVIDFHTSKVVYDQLVKPPKPITDYLTRWSGITEAALSPVTTTLSEVQTHILRLLSPPKPNPFSLAPALSQPWPTPILVGHSLESDLKALKLCHPICIDTAVIYHHPRGRPLKPGLAWLTRKWCGREIQARGEGGHDPEEDARACMELLQKKMDCGPGFGEFKTDYESIFERMSRSTRLSGNGAFKSAVVDHGNPSVMHGNKANTALQCADDEEVLNGLISVVHSHQFTFGRFLGLANVLGWLTPKATPESPSPSPPPDPTPETLATALDALHNQLKTLHAALPSRTAIVIFTGHSDPRQMSALNARKSAFETAVRAGKSVDEITKEGLRWSASDARDLEGAVELAKRGLLFLGVKP